MKFNNLYSYIISPPQKMLDDVKSLKALCQAIIGDFESLHSIGHITLVKQELEQDRVLSNRVRRLDQELGIIPQTVLTVNNFGVFPQGSGRFTIYMKIDMNDYLEKWFQKIGNCFGEKGPSTPHITIARNITNAQFLALWPYFETRVYNSTFKATCLTILENELTTLEHPNQITQKKASIFKEIMFGSDKLPLQKQWTLFDGFC